MTPPLPAVAARESVLALAAPDLAVLTITGKDRVSWLNGLVTCDLAKASPGSALYGLMVEKKGKIVTDLVVWLGEDRLELALPRALVESLRELLDRHLIMEDAEIQPGEAPVVVAFLEGPKAATALARLEAFGAHGAALDRTGLGGAVALLPAADAARALAEAMAAEGGAVGDGAAWDVLRVERRVPRFGVDFGPTTYPQEAGLERRAVSFSKGCYLGQEVVFMLESRGHVKRRLAQLRMDGTEVPPVGTAVTGEGGDVVGDVTSAVWSPTEGAPLALAMVKRAYAEAGKVVVVGASPATVVAPV